MSWTLPTSRSTAKRGGMSAREFIQGLENVKEYRDGWVAKCPSCDHRSDRPTLVIHERDRRILLHCYRGCAAMDVVEAMGLRLSDLFDDREPTDPVKRHEFHALAKVAKNNAAMNHLRNVTTRLQLELANDPTDTFQQKLLARYNDVLCETLHEIGGLK